jgi:lanosterol synthase
MTRYIVNCANSDGGWGLHLEGETTVFATAMYYVVLRLLGMAKDEEVTKKARERLLVLGELCY